ncbi:VHS domain and GAT domain and ENTH/VHS domain and VHS subgroup domain-containing protein [Strongyloides ratti]|uniref:VHS domain and GAT domain and ENTH/VHS domain and VHS subgroup domain-containing protein n=1 Tax=Strongyloides ratti TaxID=34506 RepID=A0A090KSJ4_STRRB|nr:VHS domain and GAT domain and ENTH/VHS domain and VHS subgroup domain-containing protein [Strongyloides ratti]CEF60376.1 VHS domain and GAT domain and ENTH/VHS domain and VHS subgroup domain-containing protein [Strongyloides ratti]
MQQDKIQESLLNAVESAKEAASSGLEKITDFFHGDPFETYVGKKVEMATDATVLSTENWGLNIEICDIINTTSDGAKDALRAIRKRLNNEMSKNNAIVMYTLTVLETCVKNCGIHFRTLVCSKEFVNELIKLIGPKFDAPQIIQERILTLIQSWAVAFKDIPELHDVVDIYNDLKSKGVQFTDIDINQIPPIDTPVASVPKIFSQDKPTQPIIPISNPNIPPMFLQSTIQNYESGIEVSSDSLAKLRSELDVVKGNVNVFQDLLSQLPPQSANNDEKEFLNELYETLQEMHKRIVALIQVIQNETVFSELLSINDEITESFEKFERYKNMKPNENSENVKLLQSNESDKDEGSSSGIEKKDNKSFEEKSLI